LISKIEYKIAIIGGGLAGLCCAIELSKQGLSVCLIEKESYPKHKVCGEYISNEVVPYLNYLGLNVANLGATMIKRFQLSTEDGKLINAKLPLGGFGLSRYKMDFELAQIAAKNGVTIVKDVVERIDFKDDFFDILLQSGNLITSTLAIGAYGKRSNLDIKSKRSFIQKKSPFLAVKIHVKGNFDNDLVALHNFEGGYCGVSKVENDIINLCYITTYESFKRIKDIDTFQREIVMKNVHLNKIFTETNPLMDSPLTISQISFANKTKVENHVLMCGDSAGMIHPLCGNGMGMAIRSAHMLSKIIIQHKNELKNRKIIEVQYQTIWNKEFKLRLSIGRIASSIFAKPKFTSALMNGTKYIPIILPSIIKLTHGKVMEI